MVQICTSECSFENRRWFACLGGSFPRKCDIEDVIDFGDSHSHDISGGINNCQVVVSCRRIDLPAPAVQCARRQHE